MERYDHKKIEAKWQKFWKINKTFKVEKDSEREKYYVLDMFPYPSGAGLHVGHVMGYTGTDILARYKRQCGFNVLHPIGWDSFGLPAEQYAVRTGTHPSITTEKNINTYRRQLESLGFSYDWDREITTSAPSYYKWTQWIFTKLYEKGLAYEAEVFVNFCPALGTVVANEEVENGRYKEGGYPVIKKPLKQWILKITAYADRLIDDLKDLDWPENLKKLQINWIGKSEGAKIVFSEKKTKEEVEVFTTRPDTLFGATYLVLSPEHPLVNKITTDEKKKEVDEYKKYAATKSDLERTELSEEKTGVWTGAYATHPVTNKEIPIWISDYVLIGYGTGAIMAVPAHDERDFSFAKKFALPIVCVYEPKKEDMPQDEEMPYEDFLKKVLLGDICWSCEGKSINSAYENFSINDLNVEDAKEKMILWLEERGLGKRAISYKIRDWLFSRQRYWGEPIPILHFEDGTKRTLDIDELPLIPPQIDDYKPAGDGKSPLSKVEDWMHIVDAKTNKKAIRETNTMPQWAGSCWYYLRYLDPRNTEEAWEKDKEKYWMPVDMYVGGAEHAVLHLLYSRFWHKVLYDMGLVSTNEPFKKYRYQGIVTALSYKLPTGGYVAVENVREENGKYFSTTDNQELICQVEKMSKSKLNGINPDEIIEEFGADSLRLYSMFMGPFDKEKVWNTDAVNGCRRFLNRFYDMATSEKVTEKDCLEASKLGHRLVSTVLEEIQNMHFNTAIAHMMEFLNAFVKLPLYPREIIKMAIQVLYPFAPHIATELWERLGDEEIAYAALPKVDNKYLVDEMCMYVVQVNGKLRGRLELKKDLSKEEIIEIAKSQEQIQKHLIGDVVKMVFVPNKLLNIVIKTK